VLKVKLYGRANNVTLDSNNFATVTDLTGADVYEMNCYFINANNGLNYFLCRRLKPTAIYRQPFRLSGHTTDFFYNFLSQNRFST
jgi:hypothetical protein